MLQILDTRMGFSESLPHVVIDYFSHSCLKMCKICLKRTLDSTFLDCLALTFCDVIGELLPEWACLTLQGGKTFSPTWDWDLSNFHVVISHCLTQAKYTWPCKHWFLPSPTLWCHKHYYDVKRRRRQYGEKRIEIYGGIFLPPTCELFFYRLCKHARYVCQHAR